MQPEPDDVAITAPQLDRIERRLDAIELLLLPAAERNQAIDDVLNAASLSAQTGELVQRLRADVATMDGAVRADIRDLGTDLRRLVEALRRRVGDTEPAREGGSERRQGPSERRQIDAGHRETPMS